MGGEHELVKLMVELVVGVNPMVEVVNVVEVKTWKGRLVEA